MTVTSAARHVLAHPVTVLVGVLVGVLAAAIVSWVTPRQYVATASVYVAGVETAPPGAADTFSSVLLVQQRLASYKDLLGSMRVTGPALERSGVTGGAVTASASPNSTVLSATATASDGAGAAALANAAAARFGEVLAEVERPQGPGGPAVVRSTVLTPAVATSESASPRTTLNLLTGGVVGLLAAVAFVLYRAVTDRTVRTSGALAERAGAADLGRLPRSRRGRRGADDGRELLEATRRLRTRLAVLGDGGPRLMLFAAANPGEGVTSTVGELARAFSRTGRVLVVDADLRRPGLAAHLGLPEAPGLADVLRGDLTPDEVVRSCDGVDVVTAGLPAEEPDALLASPGAEALFRRWRDEYDRVLVDGAPLGLEIDAVVVARYADATVLLAREGVTSGEAVADAAAAVRAAGAEVLGTVLTGASAHAPSRGRTPATGDTVTAGTASPAAETPVGSTGITQQAGSR